MLYNLEHSNARLLDIESESGKPSREVKFNKHFAALSRSIEEDLARGIRRVISNFFEPTVQTNPVHDVILSPMRSKPTQQEKTETIDDIGFLIGSLPPSAKNDKFKYLYENQRRPQQLVDFAVKYLRLSLPRDVSMSVDYGKEFKRPRSAGYAAGG